MCKNLVVAVHTAMAINQLFIPGEEDVCIEEVKKTV